MRTFSVKDLCQRYAVGEHTVLRWIEQKLLRAVNVARSEGRPKWRITEEALTDFELLRANAPPPRMARRRRPAEVVEFYK